MSRPPNLTEAQKKRLMRLEPALREAAKKGDYNTAMIITSDIQNILRPTGHETRLMQAKNWLFESAMESGEIDIAKIGFIGVRKKTKNTTRVYLEATALLAICHLRSNEIEKAEPLMAEVIKHEYCIKSEKRRREFKLNIIRRFEEEGTLASFKGKYNEIFDAEELQNDAGKLILTENEDQIYTILGKHTPPETKCLILRIEQFSRNQLTAVDIKLLPDPRVRINDEEVGRTVFSSIKRVLWKSLCDPKSEIYKTWFNHGMKIVLNKYYIGATVTSVLADLGIGMRAVAVPIIALIIKFGIEVYCDRCKPIGVMLER
jgi:hypothetical protein